MQDIELTGSQEVLEELQEGRTRELLLLLQDKPVPEVQDPMNIQSGLSNNYTTDADGDYISAPASTVFGSTVSRSTDIDSFDHGSPYMIINPNVQLAGVRATISSQTETLGELFLQDSNGNQIANATGSFSSGDKVTFLADLDSGVDYRVGTPNNDNVLLGHDNAGDQFPYTSADLDIVGSGGGFGTFASILFSEFTAVTAQETNPTWVTDRFSAPTTGLTEFKAWNAIRAEDVTTGSSTSANPVEFEILDSSDTVLTSSRIPASEIADSAFRLRDREYETTAGSDGQAGYQIPETGAGGHYGLPVLSVVMVEQNGSVLDPSAWEFDGNTTVTIDTSAVSITSGDSITISYDFDVFDSTLQLRAYLSRESADETSPSISHYRYEYVI